jgi:hypothetical protein
VLGNGIKIISVLALGRVETVADKPDIYIFTRTMMLTAAKARFCPFEGHGIETFRFAFTCPNKSEHERTDLLIVAIFSKLLFFCP